jgi:hypothetical protein
MIGFDPIETGVLGRVPTFIEEMIRGKLDALLSRPGYGRGRCDGWRHRPSPRQPDTHLIGTFGKTAIAVPRVRLATKGRQDHGVVESGAALLSAAHTRRPPVRSRHDSLKNRAREFCRRFLDRALRRHGGLAGHQAHFCWWNAEKGSNRAAQHHR